MADQNNVIAGFVDRPIRLISNIDRRKALAAFKLQRLALVYYTHRLSFDDTNRIFIYFHHIPRL